MKLYFDIETIPSQKPDAIERIKSKIGPPATTTTEKGKDKWWAEKSEGAIESEYRKTGLDTSLCEIISIAWAVDDGDIKVMYRDYKELPEEYVITKFFDSLIMQIGNRKISEWIGHNAANFDIRLLWHRCIVNKVNPAIKIPIDAKPWDKDVYDTMIEWTGHVSKRISQDNLCYALGIEGKPSDITGANVWDFAQRGEIERIAEYNKDDVNKVRQIYKRMTFS